MEHMLQIVVQSVGSTKIMSELSTVDGRKADAISNLRRHDYQQVPARNAKCTLAGLGLKGPRCQ
jgi:hypothetical protein